MASLRELMERDRGKLPEGEDGDLEKSQDDDSVLKVLKKFGESVKRFVAIGPSIPQMPKIEDRMAEVQSHTEAGDKDLDRAIRKNGRREWGMLWLAVIGVVASLVAAVASVMALLDDPGEYHEEALEIIEIEPME